MRIPLQLCLCHIALFDKALPTAFSCIQPRATVLSRYFHRRTKLKTISTLSYIAPTKFPLMVESCHCTDRSDRNQWQELNIHLILHSFTAHSHTQVPHVPSLSGSLQTRSSQTFSGIMSSKPHSKIFQFFFSNFTCCPHPPNSIFLSKFLRSATTWVLWPPPLARGI